MQMWMQMQQDAGRLHGATGFGANMSHAVRLWLFFLQIILLSYSISSSANKARIGLQPIDPAWSLQLQQHYQGRPLHHPRFHGYAERFPLRKLHLNAWKSWQLRGASYDQRIPRQVTAVLRGSGADMSRSVSLRLYFLQVSPQYRFTNYHSSRRFMSVPCPSALCYMLFLSLISYPTISNIIKLL